jgi:deazaflavin-dependent oxidoreductase (nitroreductase family)
MSVELTPRGTRGVKLPKLPQPLMKALLPVGNWFMRLRGAKLLELTTTGARSGLPRTVTVGWFPDLPSAPGAPGANPDGKDTWLVVASNAGAAQHPAWYINMAKNPDQVWITIDGRKIHVVPESLRGDERAEAWRLIVAKSPGYGSYETKTDREIPIVRLRAA